MKTIEYRGGVVSFRIPSHWKEEYDEKGGGTFYEEAPDSGTLRLNVLTFKAPQGKLQACGYDELMREPIDEGISIVRLPSGDGIKLYRKQVQEGLESLDLYFWEIAHCVPPQEYYLAIFSWTILTSQSGVQKFQHEIQMITDELKQIKFHPDLGCV